MELHGALRPNSVSHSVLVNLPKSRLTCDSLKGWSGSCNNPFWGNGIYYDEPMAPVNYTPGQKDRSHFGNHTYIVVPNEDATAICILDSMSGPHVGDEDLQTDL
jgi:hypothetical protein